MLVIPDLIRNPAFRRSKGRKCPQVRDARLREHDALEGETGITLARHSGLDPESRFALLYHVLPRVQSESSARGNHLPCRPRRQDLAADLGVVADVHGEAGVEQEVLQAAGVGELLRE